MNLTLRKATLKDKQKVENLFVAMLQSIYKKEDVQAYEPGYLNKFFEDNGSWIYVAESDKELVGYLSIEQYPDYLYLDDFCIDEKYRNLGIGTELLKNAQAYAIDKNVPQIRLHVEQSNLGAIKLYQRLGYKIENKENSRYLMIKPICI